MPRNVTRLMTVIGDKKCFNTLKEKICKHKVEQVELNHVGQYVIFPARFWHKGYYQITSKKSSSLHNSFAFLHSKIITVRPLRGGRKTTSYKVVASQLILCVAFQKTFKIIGRLHTLFLIILLRRRLTVKKSIVAPTDISKLMHLGRYLN